MASRSLKATWEHVATSPALARSSHTIFPTQDDLIVFSGELKPRQPVDNKIYHLPLNPTNPEARGQVTLMNPSGAPSPRVGAAATVTGGKAYLFSGRGGEEMKPLEEEGAVWAFDLARLRWESIAPKSASAGFPEGRSYHAMASDEKGTLFVHAGCPASGRLADLWAFSLEERAWKRLAEATGPPRGGSSIAFAEGKVWRMNGFDGEREQGFALDVYDVATDSWSTRAWSAENGPSPRSVCCLLPVRVRGRQWLVTALGESDPSNQGHLGAGKMLGDVWAYDHEEQKWERVEARVEGGGNGPAPRGWFAADVLPGGKGNRTVVQGGLGEDNERLGDVWVLEFE